MATEPYFFLVSEQMGFEGRTTCILISEARAQKLAEQEFFENFGKQALDTVEIYSREEFVRMCSTNVTPWVIENLQNSTRLRPSEFSYKLKIHTKFG